MPRNYFKGWSRVLTVLLTACVYFFSTATGINHQGNNFHAHHHSGEDCQSISSADQCHLKIYHGDHQHNCGHASHIYGDSEDCQACHQFLSKSQDTVRIDTHSFVYEYFSAVNLPEYLTQEQFTYHISLSRAPPVVSTWNHISADFLPGHKT